MEGTKGTEIIGHDWDNIKLSTGKYKVTKMRIEIFRYKIIEDLSDEEV